MLVARKLTLDERLRGVDTQVRSGQVTAICGPNVAVPAAKRDTTKPP